MEVKINREIRNYTEAMFFGLSLRKFIFSVGACAVAVGLYFLLKSYAGMEKKQKETTPLFLLRCVQLGISIRDLDLLTIGMVNDMYVDGLLDMDGNPLHREA